MRGLANTVARLSAARHSIRQTMSNVGTGRLVQMKDFGSNPGNLHAWTFVPTGLSEAAPLVVVLHGCTQQAALYDYGSGWSTLAEREGFALLYPEQQRANNSNLCFNWYSASDARRGQGEAKSISQMVTHLIAAHSLDSARVFITGLSAGGAMTSVMLAAYPDLFAGGAIIAGIPFASADTLPDALARMRGQAPGRDQLAARARASVKDHRPLPTLSVWHGTRDTIVDPLNADWIVDQWRDLHEVGTHPGTIQNIGPHRHETWRDERGRAVVERYDIAGMGHGTPLDSRGDSGCGAAGSHMLEAGICSTRRIANSWGIARSDIVPGAAVQPSAPVAGIARPADVQSIIEDALREAGLMR